MGKKKGAIFGKKDANSGIGPDVAARKKRNIMNNTFMLNATINSIRNEKEKALEIKVYDIEKCDTLWLHEVINSLYVVGLKNNKLPLLILENRNAQVAMKTNGRVSMRKNIKDIIMQGSMWGSLWPMPNFAPFLPKVTLFLPKITLFFF